MATYYLAASDATSQKLNVGGHIFEASAVTLSKSIFLATLLGEDLHDELDGANSPFLDRDPELFTEVLRLLRGYQFKQHPRLQWSEVKSEADFYQVPNLDALGPPPPVVLPPDMPAITTKILLSRAPTKKCHWIPRSPSGSLPDDVQDSLYRISLSGGDFIREIDISVLLALGFVQDGDNMEFTRTEKTIFYAKVDGCLPVVPPLPQEIKRDESREEWMSITYWQ